MLFNYIGVQIMRMNTHLALMIFWRSRILNFRFFSHGVLPLHRIAFSNSLLPWSIGKSSLFVHSLNLLWEFCLSIALSLFDNFFTIFCIFVDFFVSRASKAKKSEAWVFGWDRFFCDVIGGSGANGGIDKIGSEIVGWFEELGRNKAL